MDKNRSKILTILIGISLILSACGVQTGQLDEEAFLAMVDTAVAATDIAQEQEQQLTQDAMPADTQTATSEPPATSTTIPDSPTPEPSLTATVDPNQNLDTEKTEEPIKFSIPGPSVQVSVDTNCRSGPGKSYTYLGALLVGEEASIFGVDPSGSWYYINNPDQEEAFCWIWNFHAQTSGNTDPLPVYTPGPTPQSDPNFSVGFREVESCGGAWQVEFEIVNTGGVVIESVSTFVEDTVTTAKSGNSSKNDFEKKTGCTTDVVQGKLDPGDTGFTVSLGLANDPTGHLTFASITVCKYDNLNDDCRTRELFFTP